MKNIEAFLEISILIILFVAFTYGPIEQIFYRSPNASQLKSSSGYLEFRPGWKSGERLIIKNANKDEIFTCRVSSAWLSTHCPIDPAEKNTLLQKKVNLKWYRQPFWPLTSNEKQIYEISNIEDGKIVLSEKKMLDFYEKQRSILGSLLIFVSVSLVFSLIISSRHFNQKNKAE